MAFRSGKNFHYFINYGGGISKTRRVWENASPKWDFLTASFSQLSLFQQLSSITVSAFFCQRFFPAPPAVVYVGVCKRYLCLERWFFSDFQCFSARTKYMTNKRTRFCWQVRSFTFFRVRWRVLLFWPLTIPCLIVSIGEICSAPLYRSYRVINCVVVENF